MDNPTAYILDLFHKSKSDLLLVDICTPDFLTFVHNLRMKYIDSNKLSDPQFKRYTSIKKKTHTFKVQAMIHYKTQQILSLCSSRGAVHDFELFKRNLNQIPSGAFVLADKGYQGIYTLYPNSLLPLKAKTRCKLDPELKIYNQEINKRRIGIEHVFGGLKTFKILAERYRNRWKRLGLRFNLIAGIYNLELSKK